MAFVAVIEAARKRLNMDKLQVADRLGLPHKTYQRYESRRHKNMPSDLDLIMEWCWVVGEDFTYAVRGLTTPNLTSSDADEDYVAQHNASLLQLIEKRLNGGRYDLLMQELVSFDDEMIENIFSFIIGFQRYCRSQYSSEQSIDDLILKKR